MPLHDISPGGLLLAKLFEQTLAADAATIDTSLDGFVLPASYRDLLVVINARLSDAAANANIQAQFNGDSGTNYSFARLQQTNTTLAQASNGATTSALLGTAPANTDDASMFGSCEVIIQGYAKTDRFKSGLSRTYVPSTTAGNLILTSIGFAWHSAAAITKIVLADGGGGNFKSGSSMVVYGMP
jgi:hypothetical protein